MNNLILSTRKMGKTTMLIDLCSKDNYSIIVCPNRVMCRQIFDQALDMGKKIPFPITFEEFAATNRPSRFINRYYFDELQMSLQKLARGIPIEAAVIDTTAINVIDIRADKLIKNHEVSYIKKINKDTSKRITVEYDEFNRAYITRELLEMMLEKDGYEKE